MATMVISTTVDGFAGESGPGLAGLIWRGLASVLAGIQHSQDIFHHLRLQLDVLIHAECSAWLRVERLLKPVNDLSIQAPPRITRGRLDKALQLIRESDFHLGVFAAHSPNDRSRWCNSPTTQPTNCRMNHGGLHCNTWTTVVHKGAE